MAVLGSYKIPKPIQSEMKIAKKLSIRQALYGLIGMAIGAAIFIFLLNIGAGPILLAFGLLLIFLLTAGGVLLGIATVPEHWHLYGPGTRMDVIAVRVLKKNLRKNKVIYTRCGLMETEKKRKDRNFFRR